MTDDRPVDGLLRILELERIDRDIFRNTNPGNEGGRIFGGQVASLALRAAAATVTVQPEQRVHSLHAYFLRPGRYGTPITCVVDRIRDGTSFTTRRVVCLQDGEAILNLDASFHKEEPGGDFELPFPAWVSRDQSPDDLPREARPAWRSGNRPVDTRAVDPPPSSRAARAVWMRAMDRLPDDPVVHACAITYLSDMGPTRAVRRRVGQEGPSSMSASLDHCVWFHRSVRADEWLFYELETVAAGGARGVARGSVWTRDGRLVVSVTQEALVRPPRSM